MSGTPLPPFDVSELHPARSVGPAGVVDALTARVARALRTPTFEIDLLDQCARYPDGEEVHFTPHQWRLLELLVRGVPQPVTRASLNTLLFGADAAVEETCHLDILISQLRRKLEPDQRAPRYLRSVDANTYAFDPHGCGYPPSGPRHAAGPSADVP